MPKLSVWYVRASLLYMGLGFLFGALILMQKGMPNNPWMWRLLNPHAEVLVYGWTMQFVMGVAFWVLPRFSRQPRYGRVYLGWWSFALLNTGMALNLVDAWVTGGWLSALGRACVLLAVVAFVVMIWSRVKPVEYGTLPETRL
jgi:heme/copper-type cytochrome/quinol oxidase subunit 1